jgi:NTE family protein
MSSEPTLVLSSGYLAFSRHIGVAAALERAGVRPGRICGVSSGAFVGALLAAGLPASKIAEVFTERGSVRAGIRLRLLGRGGPGLFSLDPLVSLLSAWLPRRFEELPVPFAVGTVDRVTGEPVLLESGELCEAVAASCAVPWIFGPRMIDGRWLVDGGVHDRLFLGPLLERHPAQRVIVHLVAPSSYRAGERQERVRAAVLAASAGAAVTLIETPRSGATFRSLGDFAGQIEEASRIASTAVPALGAA